MRVGGRNDERTILVGLFTLCSPAIKSQIRIHAASEKREKEMRPHAVGLIGLFLFNTWRKKR